MRVLFVFLSEPWTPFNSSVAALGAAVRERGHEALALAIPTNLTVREAAAQIARIQPDLVGVSIMTRDWFGVRALLPMIKSTSRAFVVVGGYHATLAAREVSECEAVDAICIGEGERSLIGLVDLLERGGQRDSLPGMWVRGEGGFTLPLPRAAPEADIAALPSWDYEVLGNVRQMLARGINTLGPLQDSYLPTRASRGCPFDCTYCSAPKWGEIGGFDDKGTRNVRPVDHLCRELADLRDRYEPEGFEFWDEHFPVDLAWLRVLAREYPQRVGVPFRVEMHPSAATRERLEAIAAAGCSLFHCGVEQGDPEFRRRVLHRRSSDATLERVFADCRELGMKTSASVMVALPGETAAHADKTLSLLRRLRPSSLIWSTYQPLPGTVLGDQLAPASAGDGERFEDFPRRARSSERGSMTEEEERELHERYRELQRELISSDVAEGKPLRHMALPVAPVKIEASSVNRVPPRRLVELLGVSPPDAPLGLGVRVNTAEWRDGMMLLELEGPDLPAHVVSIHGRDGGRHYVATTLLSIGYRGSSAPPHLRKALTALAARLDRTTLDELRGALPPPSGKGAP